MTTSTSSSIVQNPPKAYSFSGCLLTALVILFALLGIYRLIWGFIVAYVITSAAILSLFNIGIVFMLICQGFLYFLLVFRRQPLHWLLSVAFLAPVWLILPIPITFMISVSPVRVRHHCFFMCTTLTTQSY